jgi:hypothetical protein
MERTGNTRTPIIKEPMILSKINTIVGGTIPDGSDIHGDRVKRNAYNSAIYWAQVNDRKTAYRDAYRYPFEEEYFAEQVRSTIGMEKGVYIFKRIWWQ